MEFKFLLFYTIAILNCAYSKVADLDRKVAEERRRLQEVCEAVCRASPRNSRPSSPATEISSMPPPSSTAEEQKFLSALVFYKKYLVSRCVIVRGVVRKAEHS